MSRWGRGILYFLFAVIVPLAAFLAGRQTAPRTAAATGSSPEDVQASRWLPADSEQVTKAMAADHAGDVSTALRLIDELAKRVELRPQVQAYRATLQTRLGYTFDVEADFLRLLRSNASPDASAALNAALGFNYTRRRQFAKALPCFAAVSQMDPFAVANLLHWGEALRRNGNFADAVDKFRGALVALPVTSSPYVAAQREYIAYELRLSQVEDGREAELQPELGQRLNAPAPSGYWLLTGAASALQTGDMPAAVAALKKAQEILLPEQFTALLGDYFFRSFAQHPEMNAFLTSPSREQQQARRLSMDFFIDP